MKSMFDTIFKPFIFEINDDKNSNMFSFVSFTQKSTIIKSKYTFVLLYRGIYSQVNSSYLILTTLHFCSVSGVCVKKSLLFLASEFSSELVFSV